MNTDNKTGRLPARNWMPNACSAPRKPGWENRLIAELERQMAHEFKWGKFDCLTQQADVFKALTGARIFPLKQRKYSTELGAAKLMRSYGFKDIEQVLNACFKPIAPAQARRGDCGIVERLVYGGGAGVGSEATNGGANESGKPVLAAVTIFGGFGIGRDQFGPVRIPVLSLKSAYRMG